MKVLSIGSERNLFVNNSEAQKRIKEYGRIFEELRIIVFTDAALGYPNLQLESNVSVYPTNHRIKLFYLWNAYKIVKSWRGWKPDVITCQDPMAAGFAGWPLKMLLGVPLQLQIHTDIFSPYFWRESLKNKISVILAKFLLPKADKIRVVSERIKQSLVSSIKCQVSKIVVLPIFVDVKKIQAAKIKINLHQKYPNYDFIILMASRLTREKNIGMAIEAFDSVKRPAGGEARQGRQASSVKNPLLLIVGDGPKREAFKSQITNYKLQNNVILEPWTSDLVSYYKTADLFLLTSNYEGYGRTVVEAMAAGLPVIMTDVGLAGELLIDDLDGRVVPVGNEKALAAAILELQENSAKREEFKLNSLKLLEKWPDKKEYLEKYKNSFNLTL